MLVRPPKLIKKIYPSFIWSFPDDTDGLYLTFDDGPCPEVTPKVLDLLDKYDSKATFFLIGKNVEQHPALFRDIVSCGHSVGCHSYSHIAGWGVGVDDYVQDVDMAAELIGTDLYRPPYAKITARQAAELSVRYRIVMWNILSRDYDCKIHRRSCAKNVLPHIAPGRIVVFHDSKKAEKNLLYALSKTLEAAKVAGLKCKPIIL